MADQWHVQRGDKRIGPAPLANLRHAYAEGTLSPSDLVWTEGWPQWRSADEVAELTGTVPASDVSLVAATAPDEQAPGDYEIAGEAAPASVTAAGVAAYPAAWSQPVAGRTLGYHGPAGYGVSGVPATGAALASLAATRPWVMFLSILGFVFIGLFALLILVLVIMGIAAGGARGGAGAVFVSMIQLPFLLLYLFPTLFLYRYARAIGRLNQTRSPADLETALAAQKSFWKFMGILMLIFVCIYAGLLLLMLLIFGVAGMSGGRF